MLLDWVEYEIRRLPGVIAAGVDDEAITVLVLPDVDADAVSVVISAMLVATGADVPVRVIGGSASPEKNRRRAAPIAVGSVTGIGVMATAAIAMALTGSLPWVPQTPPQEARLASPTAPAAAPAARSDNGGVAVVPGSQPTWAATEGPWLLPASLPAAQPVVFSTGMAVLSDVTPPDLEPAIQSAPAVVKTPAPTGAFGPTRLAGGEPSFDLVVFDTVSRRGGTDEDDRRRGRPRSAKGHDDNGRHRGWVQGPAQARSHSSASEAPRGGRR